MGYSPWGHRRAAQDFANKPPPLMKVKEESVKVGLKLNIQKPKIMASVPITSWEIDGETVETVADFILGTPKSFQMVIAAMKLKDTRERVVRFGRMALKHV